MMRGVIMVVAVMITPLSAVAQTRYDDVQREEATGDQDPSGRFGMIESRTMASSPQVGRTADAGSGRIGQRQRREDGVSTIEPLGRIESRVANRVQSRIRNRIDRYYDPQANETSPFRVAGDQARFAGRRRSTR
jgi:hypothetical protein